MRQNFEYRVIIGALIWIGLGAIATLFLQGAAREMPNTFSQFSNYFGSQSIRMDLEFPNVQMVRQGDLIYLDDDAIYSPIGTVVKIPYDKAEPQTGWEKTARWVGLGSKEWDTRNIVFWTDEFEVEFFATAPEIRNGDYLEYHAAPDSTAWVLQTMLHPAKRKEIGDLLLKSFQENQADIVDALKPIVVESLKDASEVIRQDVRAALDQRSDQLNQVGKRFQKELLEREVVPLVKDEIWPLVEEESKPLASKVGKKIWNEVSVFRFGWRYLYDRTPLPEKNLTEREFKRFVDEKAIPIIEDHVSDFIEIQKSIIRKLAQNEKIQASLSASAQKIAQDDEVQQILIDVAHEVFVKNNRLQNVLKQRWNGEEARKAIQLANQRLEPTITEIGIRLFGSPDTEITPEFARVLRHRILHKDSRWFVLKKGTSQDNKLSQPVPNSIPVVIAMEPGVAPYAPARERD
ncbi:MAG: hypothetical protein AAF939_19855 [Planctomycetota bacterium]